jgi:hypothetical protein
MRPARTVTRLMLRTYLKKTAAFGAVSGLSCVVVLSLAWFFAPRHDLTFVTNPAQPRTLQPASTADSIPAPAVQIPSPTPLEAPLPPSTVRSVETTLLPDASLDGIPLRGDSKAAAPLKLRVIGDSLTVGAKAFWNAVLPPVATVVSLDARSGRPTVEGLRILQGSPLEPGETLVFVLGTNDSNRYESFKALIDEVMAEAGPVNTVVWPTVWRKGPITEVNRALWDAAKRYQNLHVIEWTAELSAHPEYIDHDNTHYFKVGYEAMVRFVLSQTPRS